MPQTYGNRWEITGSLDEGGQAHTFRVKDLRDGSTDWVLKRLKNTNRIGRFKEEVAALQALDSPRIPKVEDFSFEDPAYLVYKYLGTTPQDVVRNENPTFDEVYDYFRDVVEAVVDAHGANVIHRDIKPNNVVVDSSSPHRRAYLIDFGICQFDEEGLFTTAVEEAFGNPSFAAPELGLGAAMAPTPLSDIYNLGKLLYWCVTGGAFYLRETVTEDARQRIPQPRKVERGYVLRLLDKTVREQPGERYDARQLLTAVEDYGRIMRLGVSLVGSDDQLCATCRQGTLEKMPNIRRLGFQVPGDVPPDVRWLRCQYCGNIQIHSISGTGSERDGLWS